MERLAGLPIVRIGWGEPASAPRSRRAPASPLRSVRRRSRAPPRPRASGSASSRKARDARIAGLPQSRAAPRAERIDSRSSRCAPDRIARPNPMERADGRMAQEDVAIGVLPHQLDERPRCSRDHPPAACLSAPSDCAAKKRTRADGSVEPAPQVAREPVVRRRYRDPRQLGRAARRRRPHGAQTSRVAIARIPSAPICPSAQRHAVSAREPRSVADELDQGRRSRDDRRARTGRAAARR